MMFFRNCFVVVIALLGAITTVKSSLPVLDGSHELMMRVFNHGAQLVNLDDRLCVDMQQEEKKLSALASVASENKKFRASLDKAFLFLALRYKETLFKLELCSSVTAPLSPLNDLQLACVTLHVIQKLNKKARDIVLKVKKGTSINRVTSYLTSEYIGSLIMKELDLYWNRSFIAQCMYFSSYQKARRHFNDLLCADFYTEDIVIFHQYIELINKYRQKIHSNESQDMYEIKKEINALIDAIQHEVVTLSLSGDDLCGGYCDIYTMMIGRLTELQRKIKGDALPDKNGIIIRYQAFTKQMPKNSNDIVCDCKATLDRLMAIFAHHKNYNEQFARDLVTCSFSVQMFLQLNKPGMAKDFLLGSSENIIIMREIDTILDLVLTFIKDYSDQKNIKAICMGLDSKKNGFLMNSGMRLIIDVIEKTCGIKISSIKDLVLFALGKVSPSIFAFILSSIPTYLSGSLKSLFSLFMRENKDNQNSMQKEFKNFMSKHPDFLKRLEEISIS